MNLRMRELVRNGEAFNLSKCDRTTDGDYILPGKMIPRKTERNPHDYCDLEAELWIWSIGRNKRTGQIIASPYGKFYQNPKYECLWLR